MLSANAETRTIIIQLQIVQEIALFSILKLLKYAALIKTLL